MKCQAVNCENEASVLFRYGDNLPFGFCPPCKDRAIRFSANPNKIKTQPLTEKLEELLAKLNTPEINSP